MSSLRASATISENDSTWQTGGGVAMGNAIEGLYELGGSPV
jgi:hypothetical protein